MLKDLCFEVMQACPNKCKFCSSNSSKEKKTIITFEQFKKTINYFLNHGGIEEVSISGGEPFLHPDLFKMVKFCKDNGIRTVVFTSGIKKLGQMSKEAIEHIKAKCQSDLQEIQETEPWNERLIKKVQAYYNRCLEQNQFTSITREELEILKKMGLDKIVFDLQAVNEEIDNEIMGRKRTNTYLIDSLIRARKVGLNVDVHFVPMKPNYIEFPDIIECLEIYSIYEDLEKVVVHGGKRKQPLCKQVYGFEGKYIDKNGGECK